MGAWLVESARLPFDRRWHRATTLGWHRRVSWVAAGVLAVVALATVWKSVQWRLSDPYVQGFLLVWWSVLIGLGAIVARSLTRGIWVGRGGIRLEWLFHRETVPWSRVHALWVVSAPISFGGRIVRVVVETTDGERVTVPGTDSYLRRCFGADSPDAVRHTLEAERRFYAGADLPRRRAGSRGTAMGRRPVVDLRAPDPEVASTGVRSD